VLGCHELYSLREIIHIDSAPAANGPPVAARIQLSYAPATAEFWRIQLRSKLSCSPGGMAHPVKGVFGSEKHCLSTPFRGLTPRLLPSKENSERDSNSTANRHCVPNQVSKRLGPFFTKEISLSQFRTWGRPATVCYLQTLGWPHPFVEMHFVVYP